MGYRLANVDDRAVLVDEAGDRYDRAGLSGDDRLRDPLLALADPAVLHAAADRLATATPDGPADPTVLGPPVPRPRQVFGIGLDYRSHAEESGMAAPPTPLVFTKFPGCLVGPTAAIELQGESVDFEVELVVVIGPGGRDIAAADAWSHVAGSWAPATSSSPTSKGSAPSATPVPEGT